MAFSVGFVTGVTPDKWARVWRQRETEELNLSLVESSRQEELLLTGATDVCFVRLPVDRSRFHCIPLYREVPVVVVPLEHVVTAYDEVELADLADEQLVLGDVPNWDDVSTVEQLTFPSMSVKEAIEVVASGTGIVIVPMSLARLHHRKDVEHRPVRGVPDTEIGLAWLLDNDDPRIQTFIGIVRGRTDNSSRAPAKAEPSTKGAPQKPAKKTAAKRTGQPARRRATPKPSKRRR
ncbi:Transcriptional regulator, LysR family [metagenome]|uniref:Transcriptional regulator, LysR family n=1 Tax=metagenome TaxID=256318 RepID=A0A2P2C6K2_9ZZZZ